MIFETKEDRKAELEILRQFCHRLNDLKIPHRCAIKRTKLMHGFDARIYRDGKLYAFAEVTQRSTIWGSYPDVRRNKSKLERMVHDADSYKVKSYFIVRWSCGTVVAVMLTPHALSHFPTWEMQSDRRKLPDNVYAIPNRAFVVVYNPVSDGIARLKAAFDKRIKDVIDPKNRA